MPSSFNQAVWNFDSAIRLLQDLQHTNDAVSSQTRQVTTLSVVSPASDSETKFGLGDFSSIWEYLNTSETKGGTDSADIIKYNVNGEVIAEVDARRLGKGVRWRDELDGADLEDNVEPVQISASSLRTQKRAARRARAKERAVGLSSQALIDPISDTATDVESDAELNSLRRSPDRRNVIANLLGRPRPGQPEHGSPPTSPSPPKSETKSHGKEWPVSNPFLWTPTGVSSPSHRFVIAPRDGLTPGQRKLHLISQLLKNFPDERKYLNNNGLAEPAFTPLNVSPIGIHVFVDMSNISIGFHDCLKVIRDIPVSTRVRRVPLNFHNFSLVLERGRPAAKRVLVGSDKPASVLSARTLGYETNILERVHKAKELTPRQKKYAKRGNNNNNGNASNSGIGETSGSETNTGYFSSSGGGGYGRFNRADSTSTPLGNIAFQPSKWVEQAVDEILHLKILESLIDADKPSTIVLATGDAAEAEYSGGFMRMVERALEKGWVVELVSFRMNTSSAYMRREFRNRWGSMFRWICLDDFAESLIDENDD